MALNVLHLRCFLFRPSSAYANPSWIPNLIKMRRSASAGVPSIEKPSEVVVLSVLATCGEVDEGDRAMLTTAVEDEELGMAWATMHVITVELLLKGTNLEVIQSFKTFST